MEMCYPCCRSKLLPMSQVAQEGRALAARIADCREVVIRDCGHMMMQEAPDAALDALIESLQAG